MEATHTVESKHIFAALVWCSGSGVYLFTFHSWRNMQMFYPFVYEGRSRALFRPPRVGSQCSLTTFKARLKADNAARTVLPASPQ